MRFTFLTCFISQLAIAQFAPPQGQFGSTAMYKDSTAFVAWATSCKITRGLQDISNISSGYASVGDSASPIGIADGNIVSLGDGGYVVCTFLNEIYNGAGYDFAVFENSFDGNYLELAFVEISSDGINFFRFPAASNTQDTAQTGGFGYTDATKINNLAGKYKAQYGTPFDLTDMQGVAGLDINHITHVKIIDVVGSINDLYATHDINNNKINDPWPTPYSSSGFDLDAVGVINEQTNNGIKEINDQTNISIYPNPASNNLFVRLNKTVGDNASVSIKDINGKIILQKNISASETFITLDVLAIDNGFYFLQIKDNLRCATKKIIISK